MSERSPGWPARAKYSFQRNDGLSFSSVLARHLVVKELGIATLHLGQRSFCQSGLNPQNGLGCGGRDRRRIAQQLKHLLDVDHVGLAEFRGFRIRLEIVVAVGKAQAALIDLRDDLGGVFEILVRLEVE